MKVTWEQSKLRQEWLLVRDAGEQGITRKDLAQKLDGQITPHRLSLMLRDLSLNGWVMQLVRGARLSPWAVTDRCTVPPQELRLQEGAHVDEADDEPEPTWTPRPPPQPADVVGVPRSAFDVARAMGLDAEPVPAADREPDTESAPSPAFEGPVVGLGWKPAPPAARVIVPKAAEPASSDNHFVCALNSDGELFIQSASGQDIELPRTEVAKLLHYLECVALPEALEGQAS